MRRTLLLAVMLVLLTSGSSAWWNTSFTGAIKATVSRHDVGGVELWYYPMNLTLHNTTGTSSGSDIYLGTGVNPDYSDIRFTNYDDTTEIPYWLDDDTRFYTPTSRQVWVQIPRISTSDTTKNYFYIYYGYPSAEPRSNGNRVFLLFDHFTNTALDTTKWTYLMSANATGSITFGNSKVTIAGSGGTSQNTPGIVATNAYQFAYFNVSLQFHFLWHASTLSSGLNLGLTDQTGNGTFWMGTGYGGNYYPYHYSSATGYMYGANTVVGGSRSYDWYGGYGPGNTDLIGNIQINRTGAYFYKVDGDNTIDTTRNTPFGGAMGPRFDIYNVVVYPVTIQLDKVLYFNRSVPGPIISAWTNQVSAPVAAFTCSPLVGVRNFTSTCTDSSTNVPTSWDYYSPAPAIFTGNWTNQNPKIFPTRLGYGGICMIASNGAGSNTACKGRTYFYVRKPVVMMEVQLLPYVEEYMASTDGIIYALNPLR